MRVGVLALQGDVREHLAALGELGVDAVALRRAEDLAGLGGLILPGGESTTLSLLLESSRMFDPLAASIAAGLPVFGTCAGLVLLASEVHGGRPDQRSFAALDCSVLRNGYGRQSESFETAIEVAPALGADGPSMPAVFIRAPLIERVGDGVEVLARGATPNGGGPRPVVLRHANVLASAFHPELTADRRLHRLFLAMVESAAVVRDGHGVPAGVA